MYCNPLSIVCVANASSYYGNRRGGKSLELHLAKIFDAHSLPYSSQAKTEGDKKPDFIIPGIAEYKDITFSNSRLIFLGAKTTCKDRWRQVINEASRIENKHLFTLQKGVSKAQLDEMADENLTLVVPEVNKAFFPENHRQNLLGLKQFITFAKETIS